MKILALDQAIIHTGWALYRNGKLARHGVLQYEDDNKNKLERFIRSCKGVSAFIEKTKPDLVLMEGVTYQRNMFVLIELAQYQGVLIGTCIRLGIPYEIYHPSTWRKILEFQTYKKSRQELKSLAIQYVKDKFGIDLADDEAEAVCIGQAHILKTKGAKKK